VDGKVSKGSKHTVDGKVSKGSEHTVDGKVSKGSEHTVDGKVSKWSEHTVDGKVSKGSKHTVDGKVSTAHCTLWFILSFGPTFKHLDQAEQYTYRLYKAKRDSVPNKISSFYRKILLRRGRRKTLPETNPHVSFIQNYFHL